MSVTRTLSAHSLAPLALTAAFGLLFSAPASAQNLVLDGGFEADTAMQNYSASNYFFNLGPSTFGPWTVTNGFVYVDGFGTQAHSGNNSVDLAPGLITSSLTQTLNTVSGQNYLLSFFAAAHSANTFAVKWDGNVIAGSPVSLPSTISTFATDFSGDYLQYSLPVTATSNQSVLEFDAQDPDTPGLGPNTVHLDDVSVVSAAVPEPSTPALLAIGGVGLLFVARKRRRA